MAATRPAEAIEAQAEAVVWLMLLSCSVHGGRPNQAAALCQRV